jgi:hypothetical protein
VVIPDSDKAITRFSPIPGISEIGERKSSIALRDRFLGKLFSRKANYSTDNTVKIIHH